MADIARHRAAIGRARLSKPVRLAIEAGLVREGDTLLDYGCGRGGDVKRLRRRGVDATGWDPHYFPDAERRTSRVVNLGYVLNVIERPRERVETLKRAWSYAEDALVVSAQVTVDAPGGAVPFGDGVVTSRGTFQKYYEQQELEQLLHEQLGVRPVALGLGIFVAVRDAQTRSELMANQFRRRARPLAPEEAGALFEENQKALEPLVAFLQERGRWPASDEREAFSDLSERFGSVGRAIKVLTHALPSDFLESAKQRAEEDLLVFLALARFDELPKFGDLGPSTQRDVRSFFGSLKSAQARADQLLFSIGDSRTRGKAARSAGVGKRTSDALYVHVDAIDELPGELRVFEGCARRYVGGREGANLVKLSLRSATVSYLSYPDFDRDPHPALARSLKVDFRAFRLSTRDYATSRNPPILHRKELFVGRGHPNRAKFERLTQQEERWGLFDGPSTVIGTRDGWQKRLDDHGAELRGHRLIRSKA